MYVLVEKKMVVMVWYGWRALLGQCLQHHTNSVGLVWEFKNSDFREKRFAVRFKIGFNAAGCVYTPRLKFEGTVGYPSSEDRPNTAF